MGELKDFSGLAGRVGGLDDQGLVSALAEIDDVECALGAARVMALAEFDRRRLAVKLGAASTTSWWARSVNITDYRAGLDVDMGFWLTGHPRVLTAMTRDRLHRDHAAAVREGIAVVSSADPELDLDVVEAELVEVALRDKPGAVTRRAEALALPARQAKHAREKQKYDEEMAERLRREQQRHTDAQRRAENTDPTADPDPDSDPDRTDEDGPAPVPVPPARAVPPAEDTTLNIFTLVRLANGRYEGKVNVDKLTAEEMLSTMRPLTTPVPGPNGERDDRSPARRNADALRRVFSMGGVGTLTTTLLVVSLAELTGHKGSACTDGQGEWPYDLSWTGPVSEELAKLITCDSDLVPIIVDDAGVPLAEGRRVKLATREQRWAVYVRDRCCVSCGKDKQWCQIHHIELWDDGGLSDLNNFALLCVDCHHRLVHHGGWDVVMGEDGHPWMVPPATVDPQRQPIPSFHRRRKHRRHRKSA